MVFEEIIRHSPRRRASPRIAGGFRPTARAHTGLQQFSDTLTVVQVCRVTRDAPFSAKRRPKFISVTVSGARFWERSTLSNWFNLYGNCSTFRRISLVDHKRATWTPGALLYPLFCENDAMPKYISAYFLRRPTFISVTVSGARFRERSISSIGFNLCENCSTFRRISLVDHKRATWTPGVLLYPLFCENDAMPKYISAYFLRRPTFISVTVSGARFWERSTLSNWFNLCENCCIDRVRLPWVASRRRSVAGILAFCQLRRSMRYY
jgi:hypothetical protein